MPIYEVEAPNGKIFEIEGDTFPTEAELNNIFSSFNDTKPQKKGVDITPSGLIKQVPRALATPIIAGVKGQTLKEAWDSAGEGLKQAEEEHPIFINSVPLAGETYLYSQLPVLRAGKGANLIKKAGTYIANAGIQGGVPGALEGQKEGNALGGAGFGTTVAMGLQGAFPVAGKVWKVANKAFLNAFPGLKENTVRQLINPNSKALDLTEDSAQNLLMNTTERIQRDYKQLMDQAGQKVQEATLKLPENIGVTSSSLKNSLNDIYNSYSTSGDKALNVAFNKAGNIYDNITDLVDKASNIPDIGTISAPKLNDIMNNIKSYKIKWDEPNANLTNGILKQIYGNYARRLGNLSPELRKANKAFSKLANFEDNEGVRRILQPSKVGDLDAPSSALRNYNSTVTKGNTNRNIQDLENILVENGKQPFLNDIDDINAANALLKTEPTGINPFGLTDKLKNLAERPILMGARGINRAIENTGLANKYARLKQAVPESVKKLIIPMTVRATTPMLYGGVDYEDYGY